MPRLPHRSGSPVLPNSLTSSCRHSWQSLWKLTWVVLDFEECERTDGSRSQSSQGSSQETHKLEIS